MTGMQTEGLAEYILVEYRWVIVICALLPMSFLWKIWSAFRNYVVFKMNSAPKQHDKKVKDVQRQINEWLKGDRSTKLCTSRPGWQTMSYRQAIYKKTFTNINVNLVDILEVDTKNLTVRCEPLVTMGQLSRTLEPLGLALAVVPELDQLTVGGLVMGTGVETSSHIHGLFQHICTEYELVLADGSVITCSKTEHPELFYAVPWSYGTLGFLTSAVIKLVPAKKYVRLEYHPCTSLSELSKRLSQESLKEQPHQFIEALLFSKETGVLMTGDMVDEEGPDGKINPIGEWYSEWFFTQVRRHLKNYQDGKRSTVVEYIPLRHYYHRHTRSLFWELQVYPIWLCPFKVFRQPGQLRVTSGDWQMFVDVGIYGVPKAKGFETVPSTRRVEDFVIKNKGFQMLYADTYTTLEEFRQMFDHTLYDKLRETLPFCKDAFPEIYGKVNRHVRK
ncbi:Delta(24)-sterol reductase [Papilio machaon]|uniref:Delta(24)-sterol reductase n=1 Tax=Papilio machaon TaxID=76193 RepID=A0A0N1IAL4_PAPMA|nr:Delta(24)-sterol reductase [Papilio machaon]